MNVLQAILYLNKVWNFFNDFLFLNILIYIYLKNEKINEINEKY